MHFYESMTLMTKDNIQIKTYCNEHPKDFIIGVPKYIPTTHIRTEKLQLRKFNGKEYNRFNIRAIGKDDMKDYVTGFKKYYPDYFKKCPEKDTWLMGVPVDRIVKVPDSKTGVNELMRKENDSLDKYMLLTKSLVNFLCESGVKKSSFGTTNSTLLGNYTYGKSDIDLIVFGKSNYWKVMNFLDNAKHELLRWRTTTEWKKHYIDYFPGMNITEEEYIKQQSRKHGDGLWGEIVFSLFGVSEPEDEKEKFEDAYSKHVGLATIEATIKDDQDSYSRMGIYEISDVKIIDGEKNFIPERICFYSRNLVGQAKKGERIICTGMVEKLTNIKNGTEKFQITIGLFESYEKWKGKEYMKLKW